MVLSDSALWSTQDDSTWEEVLMEGWASVKKAAKYADVSERTMRSWMKDGLRYSRLPSGMIRIRYSAVVEFLEAHQVDERKRVVATVDEVMGEFLGRAK